MSVKKIFVVDDDEFFLETLTKQLSSMGEFQVLGYTSVERAVGQMKKYKPEIIFLDHLLGGVNGIDAIPLIKELNPTTEIVIVSGQQKPILVKEALDSGALKYLQKNALLVYNVKGIINDISPEEGMYVNFWKKFIQFYNQSSNNMK